MSKKQIDGGELCVVTLKKAGIDDLFVLHGGHLDPIFQAALDHDVRLIDTRHEAAAGHAADAYARQTGRVSCALATAGPGFTNVLTAVTQCYLDCIPVLFIVGGPPLRDAERWPLQGGIDQIAMAKPVTRWATQITRTELIPHLIGQALREATNGQPGPVLVEIPIDVLFARVEQEKAPIPETLAADSRPGPEKAMVQEIAEVLGKAERPAIICGGGMLFSDATETLREFVSASGIPVFTNSKARGALPPAHELFAGAHTNLKVAEASGLGTPDVAIMLGARFGMFTEPGMLGPGRIPTDDCTIIQVDIGARELGRIRHVHYPVVSDCKQFLLSLMECTQEMGWPDWKAWSGALHNLTGWHAMAYESVVDKTRALHPYKAVSEVIKALPEDAIICADGGEASGWVEMVASPQVPGSLMSHGYLGCLGIGIPFALGAKAARPDKAVVCITGDGSVGFNIQEFDTMVRHDLPVLTVVLNNKAWGMCVHGQQSMFGDNRLVVTTLGDAHYEKVAEGFGVDGAYIEKAEDIGPAVADAIASGKPACINIITDLEAVPGDTSGEKISKAEEKDGEIAMPYYDNLKE